MRERRKNKRIGVSFPIECRNLPNRNYFYTVSKDLSVGGAKIINSDFLPKDNELKLNINFIDKVLNVKAKVNWCNKDKASDRYSSGLEFVELTESNKKELLSFLDKITNS